MSRPPPERLRGRLRGTIPGRVRIVLDAIPEPAALAAAADALAALPSVRTVEIRPVTGSVVVRHEGPTEALLDTLGGVIEILPPDGIRPVDPIDEARRRLEGADAMVSRLTGGRADLTGIAFVGLFAAGLLQLARGRIAGPALTLFGQAATVALTRAARAPDDGSPGGPPPRRTPPR
mgnify:CR=1 FL=1